MAVLHAFRALIPAPDLVEQVVCVPYDVINSEEARRMAAGKPHSFLRVIRPEVDLAEDVDEHADVVYLTGARNLKKFELDGILTRESGPSLYVYRLIMDGRSQVGIFGCASVSDYDADIILKHEKTRPDKEDDRTRHILTQQAHAEPVMLTFRSNDSLRSLFDTSMEGTPLFDVTTEDGIHHTLWRVGDNSEWIAAFDKIGKLYVADGHHRCKAASRAAEQRRQSGESKKAESQFFPAVMFPLDQMQILAYNRVVKKVPNGTEAFLARLKDAFEVTSNAEATPSSAGSVSLYINGAWLSVKLPPTTIEGAAARLDVARLGEFILEPLLDINDPRTDPNIQFIGGIRGTAELERLVDGGKAELAISMYPTQPEELLDVSDAGELMPPKSTWFEPKLRSGFVVHTF